MEIITAESIFIIYGAGEIGEKVNYALRKAGFSVYAALDKNKSGENIVEGIFTYRLGSEPEWKEIRKKAIVVICLADGMLHKMVAETLYQNGYCNIVFLPIQYSIHDKKRGELTQLYNYFLDDCTRLIGTEIKEYSHYAAFYADVNASIIDEQKDHVICWVRPEILFSESYELWEGDKSKVHGKLEIKDKNIMSDHPCENLFAYFTLDELDRNKYFNGFKDEKNEEQKEKELRKRENLYRIFKRELERGMDFFIKGAPMTIWNPKNYFNLVGGHHRTAFLINQRRNLLPVKMRKCDFVEWCHMDIYEKFLKYVKDHNIVSMYAPVPHPGMLNFPVECEEFGETKLKCILRFIAHMNMRDMHILDCSRGQGYYARNMERIGVCESVYMDENIVNTELALLIDALLYRDKVVVVQKTIYQCDVEKKYEIVIAMDKFVNTDRKIIVPILDSVTNKFLFWESCEEEDKMEILQYTSFKEYILLHKEIKNMKIWELGVFVK